MLLHEAARLLLDTAKAMLDLLRELISISMSGSASAIASSRCAPRWGTFAPPK